MNLARVQEALLAMQRCEDRTLQVRRPRNESDVREMAGAGLIEATLGDGTPGSVTSIEAVTEAGRKFLQTFPANYRFCEQGFRTVMPTSPV